MQSPEQEQSWEDFSRKIILGYFNPQGAWVPGVLESIRTLQSDVAKLSTFNAWMMRVGIGILAAQFFGLNNVKAVLALFGH